MSTKVTCLWSTWRKMSADVQLRWLSTGTVVLACASMAELQNVPSGVEAFLYGGYRDTENVLLLGLKEVATGAYDLHILTSDLVSSEDSIEHSSNHDSWYFQRDNLDLSSRFFEDKTGPEFEMYLYDTDAAGVPCHDIMLSLMSSQIKTCEHTIV